MGCFILLLLTRIKKKCPVAYSTNSFITLDIHLSLQPCPTQAWHVRWPHDTRCDHGWVKDMTFASCFPIKQFCNQHFLKLKHFFSLLFIYFLLVCSCSSFIPEVEWSKRLCHIVSKCHVKSPLLPLMIATWYLSVSRSREWVCRRARWMSFPD